MRFLPRAILIVSTAAILGPERARAADLVSGDEAAAIGLRPYWSIDLEMARRDCVDRISLLDDNLYVMSVANNVMAVHAGTGVLRWDAEIAKPGHRVMGPTHAGPYALFTSQMGVEMINRRTGKPAEDPRVIKGVVIDSTGDIATINRGSVHGLEPGTQMAIYRRGKGAGETIDLVANLSITVAHERDSRGRLTDFNPAARPAPGDTVEARVVLPRRLVRLPFAPSSPAISEGTSLFYGASNRRFYKVHWLDGIRAWEFATPAPISATPVLAGGTLYVADQTGQMYTVGARDRSPGWKFSTEGAVFVEPWVEGAAVYVSSSDRWLYALDIKDGHRRGHVQFATTELGPPVVADRTVFVTAPGQGLFALEVATGKERWHVPGRARFLTAADGRAYVALGQNSPTERGGLERISAVEISTGRETGTMPVGAAVFAAAAAGPLTLMLADAAGHVQCLRSAREPYIRPEQLAAVLREDRDAALGDMKKPAASRPAGRSAAPAGVDDPFRSRSTVPPAAGAGLAGETEKPAEAVKAPPPTKAAATQKSAATKPAEAKEKKGKEKEKGDEGEEGEKSEEKEGGDEGGGKDEGGG